MLPRAMRKLGDFAFYGCTHLTDVRTEGSLFVGRQCFEKTPYNRKLLEQKMDRK